MKFLMSMALSLLLLSPLLSNAQSDALLQSKDAKVKSEEKLAFLGSLLSELVRVQDELTVQDTSELQVLNAWTGLIVSSEKNKLNLDQLLRKYSTAKVDVNVSTYTFEQGWLSDTSRARKAYSALVKELAVAAQSAQQSRDVYLGQLTRVNGADQNEIQFVVSELNAIKNQNLQVLGALSDLEYGTERHTNKQVTDMVIGGLILMCVTALISLGALTGGLLPLTAVFIMFIGGGTAMVSGLSLEEENQIKSKSYQKVRETISNENLKIIQSLKIYEGLVRRDLVQP